LRGRQAQPLLRGFVQHVLVKPAFPGQPERILSMLQQIQQSRAWIIALLQICCGQTMKQLTVTREIGLHIKDTLVSLAQNNLEIVDAYCASRQELITL